MSLETSIMAQIGRLADPKFLRSTPFLITSFSTAQTLVIPSTIKTRAQNNPTRPISLSITSTHKNIKKKPSALVSEAPVVLEDDKKEEVLEEEGGWKYPFSDVVVKKKRSFFNREWTTRDRIKVGIAVLVHGLCLFAPFTFNWGALGVAMTLVVFTGLGLTLSFHRNLAHRSFNLPKWLEYFWAYCGSHALQGSPMTWVSVHRTHHLFPDKEGDPHSPIEGFWFAQMNWIFDTKYHNQKQGGELGRVEDMYKQPFYRFMEDTYIAHPIALAGLLYALGGFPYVVWGMGVRIVLTGHFTLLIGSVLHIWGNRTYNTPDSSKNNWLMALITFGEGWHNNHHAFEFSARTGLEWWQIDTTWYVIKLLGSLGLATDIKLPTEAQKQKALLRWT